MRPGASRGDPLPSLRATTIFIDIDETITTSTAEAAEYSIDATLIRAVARANGVCEEEAERKMRNTFDPEAESIDTHYRALGLDPRDLWTALMEWFPTAFRPFPDAVEAIRDLHGRGFRLFTCTTNGNLICRAKLAVAGLGGYEGSPFFMRLIGGSEVHPAGKSTPAFYENLLRIAEAGPQEVVHVGDDPHHDLALARGAGITQVVLPARNQEQDWVMGENGGIYVKSLSLLCRMMTKK
jgi:FMN phosphatase YigB (HAD superfamily)